MKIFKKGLGVLLAVALVFSLLAPTAFAAVRPGYLMSIRTHALDNTVNPGDTVTLVVSLNSSAAFPTWNAGEYDVGYDGDYFSMTRTFGTDITMAGYTYNGSINPTYSFTEFSQCAPTADEITNFGWDTYMHVALVDDTGMTSWFNTATENNVFAINLTVKAGTPAGVYYVGLGYSGYDNMTSYCNEETMQSAYHGFGLGVDYGLADPDSPLYDLSEAVVPIYVGPQVANNGVKVQWDTDASHIKMGYRGTISNMALTADANKNCNELSEIGVIFSTTIASPTLANVTAGTASKAICTRLYDNADGTYSFRAIVTGAPINNTTTINAVMYITTTGGTTTYYSLPSSKTPQVAYNDGVAHGLPAFA